MSKPAQRAGFGHKAVSFPPLRRRLKGNCPAGAREAPLEGFFDAVKEKWGPCPPYIPSLGNMQKPGAATRSPPLLCPLLGNLLHGISFDDVAWPMKTGFHGDPVKNPRQAEPASGKVVLRKTLGPADAGRRFAAREGDRGGKCGRKTAAVTGGFPPW